MQQPLTGRLTKEEKRSIKDLYNDFEKLGINGASADREIGHSHCLVLELIFSEELFEEDKKK